MQNWYKKEEMINFDISLFAITTYVVVSTNQKILSYWSRVKEHYQQNIGYKDAEIPSIVTIGSR